MFKVIATQTYLEEIDSFPRDYKEILDDLPLKLKENPYSGKPLTYRFLREKKIKEKRVYYLVYEDLKLVLLVAVSGKKDQQHTIDFIKSQLDEFKLYVEKISKQVS